MSATCQTWAAALQAHHFVFSVAHGVEMALLIAILVVIVDRRKS